MEPARISLCTRTGQRIINTFLEDLPDSLPSVDRRERQYVQKGPTRVPGVEGPEPRPRGPQLLCRLRRLTPRDAGGTRRRRQPPAGRGTGLTGGWDPRSPARRGTGRRPPARRPPPGDTGRGRTWSDEGRGPRLPSEGLCLHQGLYGVVTREPQGRGRHPTLPPQTHRRRT